MNITFIKIGGSVITDKNTPLTARTDTMKTVARCIADFAKDSSDRLIIGNGAGSFGHYYAATLPNDNGNFDQENTKLIHDEVTRLNTLFVEELRRAGIAVQSLAANEYATNIDGKLVANPKTLANQLSQNHLSLYGDMVQTGQTTSRVASTEEIFLAAAEALADNHTLRQCILGTNVAGVLDEYGKTIPALSELAGSASNATYDVSGGMKSKVAYASQLANYFAVVRIVSALSLADFSEALAGNDIGTKILKVT